MIDMRDYKVKFGNRVARFSMEMRNTDAPVGTEELAHMEIVSAIIHQLTKDLTPEEIAASGFDKYYVDHTLGLWPQAAGGVPFTSTFFQSKGDPIRYLREREIVHFQRFGESLRIVQDNLDSKNFYAINPAFLADKAR